METKHHWPRGGESEGVCIKCGATIDSTCTKCGQGHHALLTCDPPMEQQYRILAPEEIIQEGDELRERPNALTDWVVISKLGSVVGLTVKDASIIKPPLQFRRPIPAKSECPKCGKEHPSLTCEQFRGVSEVAERAASFVVKVPPVKESLTIDPDESSDNSRSFAEIERLKLKLEKAEAELNENGKILEHLQTQRDTAYNARDGIADLYTKECELRRTAERERDEAKSKVIGACSICWTNSWSPADANEKDSVQLKDGTWARCDMCYMTEGLKKITKERDALRAEVKGLREALEKIVNGNLTGTYAAQIAQAALAGKGEKS